MNEWKKYKLKDVVNINVDNYTAKDGWEYINYLDTANLTEGKINFIQKLIPGIDKIPSRAKRKVKNNDVLISTVRPNQKHFGIIKKTLDNILVSTGFAVLRAKENIIEPYFLYVYITQDDITEYLSNVAEDSTTAYPSITPNVIADIDLLLPSYPEQKAIAAILSSLDDKICLLHRNNKTLEAMAETIFRQWFVEKRQKNWDVVRLGDIIDVIESGSRPKGGIDSNLDSGIPSIGAENINGIGSYDYSKTKYITEGFYCSMRRGQIHDYDVLVYKDGAYIGKKSMFGNGFPYIKCAVNEHVFILRANSKANQSFLYFLLDEGELSQLNTNSAQPGLNQESVKSMSIVLPPTDLIEKYENIVKPWIDKIFFNSKQIHTLSVLRNTLIPKLISGEIRVKM